MTSITQVSSTAPTGQSDHPNGMAVPFLHVGYHKTGTSWLQESVFNQAAFGFVSPWSPNQIVARFVTVNPFLFDPARTLDLFKAGLMDAGAKNLVPVVSNEDLSGYPATGKYYGREVADRLAATFTHAKVLIGIREQKSMLMSMFRQYIRQGGNLPLEDFIGARHVTEGFSPLCRLDHFEYDAFVRYYQDLFGPESVLVMPLELLKQDTGAYLSRVRSFLGINNQGEPSTEKVNVGSGGMTLALQRRLNRWTRKNSLGANRGVGWRLAVWCCRASDRFIPGSIQRAVDTKYKQVIKAHVGDYYEPSNTRLSKIIDIDLSRLGYSCDQGH